MLHVSAELFLRQPLEADAANYVALIAGSDLHEFIPVLRQYYCEEHARNWINRCRDVELKSGHPATFVISDSKDSFIGQIGLDDFDRVGQSSAEIGFWLGKTHRARGVMSAVLPVFLDYSFTRLRVGKILARTLSSNVASQRLLLRGEFSPTPDSADESILFYEREATT